MEEDERVDERVEHDDRRWSDDYSDLLPRYTLPALHTLTSVPSQATHYETRPTITFELSEPAKMPRSPSNISSAAPLQPSVSLASQGSTKSPPQPVHATYTPFTLKRFFTPKLSRAHMRRKSSFMGDTLAVMVATWNVGNQTPDQNELSLWLPTKGVDLVVIGVQECNYHLTKDQQGEIESKHKDLANSLREQDAPTTHTESAKTFRELIEKKRANRKKFPKNRFDKLIQVHFGEDFRKVASLHLMDMRIIVLCTTLLRPYVKTVKKVRKATGIGGVIGNKGGLMIGITIHTTQLCFLSCHLTPHESEKQVLHRNQDVFDILRTTSHALDKRMDITHRFDHMFVFGDLNYRIGGGEKDIRPFVMKAIENEDYDLLYREDQLRREMEAGNVLCGFHETEPKFAPTYKFHRGDEHLVYDSKRIPSYCDRILWSSLPGVAQDLRQVSLSSAADVTTSDHKPVRAIFFLRNPTAGDPTASPRRFGIFRKLKPIGQSYHLNIANLEIRQAGGFGAVQLMIEFHSSAAEKSAKERMIVKSDCVEIKIERNVSLAMKTNQSNQLKQKHLLITVWDVGRRHYRLISQAVISLDQWTDEQLHTFAAPIVKYGLPQGTMVGALQLSSAAPLPAEFATKLKAFSLKTIQQSGPEEGLVEDLNSVSIDWAKQNIRSVFSELDLHQQEKEI
eukprot:c6811_g1_i1.p1 GENE.c6811_g1_i1~~c6811_g1_i1.p1  ORF type:complete len:678 (+),score=147.83 c6811_g1_i1:54-2087(+)